jgi:hypothetical protein
MNRLVSRIAVAALLLLPAVSEADPLLSFGPDVPMFITVAASVRRENNVFLSSQDQQADTIYVLVPGINLQWTGGKSSLGIALSEQFSRYSTNRELDDHLLNFASNLAYKGANSSLGLAASYQQDDQTSLSIQSSDQTVKHSLADVTANGEMQVGGKTSIGVGVQFDRTIYPEVGYIDTDVWNFPVNVYYAVTPKTDLSLGYQNTRTRLATGTGNSEDNFYNVGARGQFTAKLSGQVRVGVTDHKPEVGAKSSDLGLSANVDYVATPKTTFDLAAGSGYSTSPLGTGEKVFSMGLTGRSQLSEAWLATLGATYDSTNYLSTLGRVDGFWVANIGLSYIWTSTTNFEVDYVYRKNSSNVAADAFNDNVLTFTVASRF